MLLVEHDIYDMEWCYVEALGLHSASRLQRDLNEVRDAVANQGFSVLK